MTCEQRHVFRSLVGCQHKPRVADEPQRLVGLLPALLQQLTHSRLARDSPSSMRPPGSSQDRRYRSKTMRTLPARHRATSAAYSGASPGGIVSFPRVEGEQGITTVISCKRLVLGAGHVPMLPSSGKPFARGRCQSKRTGSRPPGQ